MRRFLLVLFSCTLALADEVPVAPLDQTMAPREQLEPDVVRFGNGWLAAWSDYRDAHGGGTYATRIGPAGEVLDPQGVRILDAFDTPSIACAPERCLVVGGSLRYAVVDADLKVLARGRIESGPAFGEVRAIYNGRDFLVFWFALEAPGRPVRAATIDVDGQVKGDPADLFAISADGDLRAAAFDGSRVLLAYAWGNQIRLAVLSATGTPIAESVLDPEIRYIREVSLVPAPGGFLAVWERWWEGQLNAVRIDRDGVLQGTPVTLATGANAASRLVADGDGYILYYFDHSMNGALVRRSLSIDLAPGPPEKVALPAGSASPQLAVAPGPLAVVSVQLSGLRYFEFDVFAVGRATNDVPVAIAYSPSAQMTPSVAAGPDGRVVAWESRRGGNEEPQSAVEAALIDRSGASRVITLSTTTAAFALPRVAAAGDVFLVVWREIAGIVGQIVRDGAPVGPVIRIAENAGDAVVAGAGSHFVVAWTQALPTAIGLARVFPDGTVVRRPEIVPVISSSYPLVPALACASGECLLVYRTLIFGPTCPRACTIDSRLWGIRFDDMLVARDAEPFPVHGNSTPVQAVTAAAAGDGRYAVGWDAYGVVQMRVIDATGAVGPTFQRSGLRHTLARQGDSWVLIRDTGDPLHAALRLYRFADDGTGIDYELRRDGQSRTEVEAAMDGASLVLAYERTTRYEAAGGVPRVYVEVIEAPRRRVRAVGR